MARLARDGPALPGQGGLIDAAAALVDDAVHRDHFAGAHEHSLADSDVGHGHHGFPAGAQDPRGIRHEPLERPDRLGGAGAAARLEEAAEGDEDQDHRGRVEVGLTASHEGDHRCRVRRERSDRDQWIDAGPQRREAAERVSQDRNPQHRHHQRRGQHHVVLREDREGIGLPEDVPQHVLIGVAGPGKDHDHHAAGHTHEQPGQGQEGFAALALLAGDEMNQVAPPAAKRLERPGHLEAERSLPRRKSAMKTGRERPCRHQILRSTSMTISSTVRYTRDALNALRAVVGDGFRSSWMFRQR